MPSRIEDYALIGDCESAGLVARDGSIDWLCFPRFDSPACFAALLGSPDNGCWRIAPRGAIGNIRRRYLGDTLILDTHYTTDEGEVSLIDFMPLRADAPDVMRIVAGLRGQVPMRMDLTIRFDYGSSVPWVRRTRDGIRAIAGPDKIYCHAPVPMHGEDWHTVADFTVAEGQRLPFRLTWCPTHSAEPPAKSCEEAFHDTRAWWHKWTSRCTYQGEWREAVLRSLITLKALTYYHTGGIVAAATTSLPEQIGGVRNWDYRYCWLRDSTFTLYSLMTGGYTEEARAWRRWLVDAVAGDPSQLQIMYGLAGERRLTEIELDWLPGYQKSRPVRVGNAAHKQFQLDVYGEVMDSLQLGRRMGLKADENAWHIQQAMMQFVEKAWDQPDEGIWEVRGPRRDFTHSKVMAWVAVDRAIKGCEQYQLEGDLERWRQLRDRIHQEVCERGFNKQLNSFVQYYDSQDADASLLMLPMVGFLPPTDPRIAGTVAYVQKQLLHDGFVDRYPTCESVDGLPPG